MERSVKAPEMRTRPRVPWMIRQLQRQRQKKQLVGRLFPAYREQHWGRDVWAEVAQLNRETGLRTEIRREWEED